MSEIQRLKLITKQQLGKHSFTQIPEDAFNSILKHLKSFGSSDPTIHLQVLLETIRKFESFVHLLFILFDFNRFQ